MGEDFGMNDFRLERCFSLVRAASVGAGGFLARGIRGFAARLCLMVLLIFGVVGRSNAATWYVDANATGANNGTSWANAWKALTSVSGVGVGDTVYISGGASGSSESYSLSGGWTMPQGNSSGVITYQIGQDSAHNGTAIFNGGGTGGGLFNGSLSYTTILGDAGDGNMHFQASNFSGPVVNISSFTGLRIGYINFATETYAMHFPSASGGSATLEFDHCYYYKIPNPSADEEWAMEFLFAGGSTYDVIKIHDNTIYIPQPANTGGLGDDGLDVQGSGYSLYNNTIIGYMTNASLFNSTEAGAHQDGSQQTIGSYVKFYGNVLINGGNTCLFLDGYSGGFNHVRVYNNIMYDSMPMLGYPRGMDAIPDGGPIVSSIAFNDCVIANNLFANFGYVYNVGGNSWMGMFGLRFAPITSTASVSYSGNLVANNIGVNCGFSLTSTGTTLENNVEVDGANTGNFNAYVQLPATSPADDFHLLKTATSFIQQGANLSSYFATDKDGNTRPASGAWDLGPYQYGGTNSSGGGGPTNTAPTVAAITQNGTDVDPNLPGIQVYSGTTESYSSSATADTGDATTWTWTYSTNGTPIVFQSGSGTIPSVSYIYPASAAGLTYTWTLSVTDSVNHLVGQSQLAIGVEAPPAPGAGLTFQATSGVLTPPMVALGNYIYQPTYTSPATSVAAGGIALYVFTITNAGSYVIQGLVNAPSDSENSFWINIDAMPVDPTMIWDVTVTSGFEQRLVSWRGTGSDGVGTDPGPQFSPEVFALSAGTHSLYIVGREANTELQGFSILKVPTAPTGLRVL
jgi:hypothetical protein